MAVPSTIHSNPFCYSLNPRYFLVYLYPAQMSETRRLLEIAEQEQAQRRRRRAERAREREARNSQLAVAIAMMEQESEEQGSGSRQGKAPNTDRKREERGKGLLEDYFNPMPIYSPSDFRRRFRMAPHLFNKIMHDICNYDPYFVQRSDATGALGLLPEQKLTSALRMLAYGASADQVDEYTRLAKSTSYECLSRFCHAVEAMYTAHYLRRPTHADYYKLLKKGEARGFPGMIGSIDCMHWQWKNCPTGWQGGYGNRKGQRTIILEAVAGFDTWVWHAFFGVPGAQNDINVLGMSPVFNQVLRGEAHQITYQINNHTYDGPYYLADGIYPRWTSFVKTIPNPTTEMEAHFSTKQEAYRKDVERCFGILQARWSIIRGAARLFDEEELRSIMMTCIILHNMIVEDEYDYDAPDIYEPDPMNNSLTQIYIPPKDKHGQPVIHDPVERQIKYQADMMQRYTEMQDSFIHVHRQEQLVIHNWNLRGHDV